MPGNQTGEVIVLTELGVVYLFLALLGLFIIVGALIPRYLPSLVRYVDSNVLKEEKEPESKHH